MKHVCPHCGGEINPGKMLGAVRSPKKEAVWRANGERLRKAQTQYEKNTPDAFTKAVDAKVSETTKREAFQALKATLHKEPIFKPSGSIV